MHVAIARRASGRRFRFRLYRKKPAHSSSCIRSSTDRRHAFRLPRRWRRLMLTRGIKPRSLNQVVRHVRRFLPQSRSVVRRALRTSGRTSVESLRRAGGGSDSAAAGRTAGLSRTSGGAREGSERPANRAPTARRLSSVVLRLVETGRRRRRRHVYFRATPCPP